MTIPPVLTLALGVVAGLLTVTFGTPAYILMAIALAALAFGAPPAIGALVGTAGLTSLAVIGWANFTCSPSASNPCSDATALMVLSLLSAAVGWVAWAILVRRSRRRSMPAA